MAKNILISYHETGDIVALFLECDDITSATVTDALAYKGITKVDVYEVPDEQMQYYSYQPLWPTGSVVENIRRFANLYQEQKAIKPTLQSV